MEPDAEQIEGSGISFHGHMAELFRRLMYIGVGSLSFGLLGYFLAGKLVHVLYRALDLGASGGLVNPELVFTDKILWGGVITLVAFHFFFVSNLYGYVSPGLYPHEKRMFLIPLVWAMVTPITTLFFLFIYAVIINRLGNSASLEPDNVRAWFIRFFLMVSLSTFLIALPRQKRTLSYYAYCGLLILIWLLPNHVFDTLIILLTEVCLILSIAIALVIPIWAACEPEINLMPFGLDKYK